MARRLLAWLLATVFVAALAAAGAGLWAGAAYRAPGPLQTDTTVELPPGTGVAGIAEILTRNGVFDTGAAPYLFALAVRVRGQASRLQAGEYAFAPGASMREVIDKLVGGDVIVHRLTIPEGLTVPQVLALVEMSPTLEGAVGAPPPEGSLLPDTYHFRRGDSRAGLVARMAKAMDEALASLWSGRAANLPLGDPREAVILASIVEKETAVPAERPTIAGVFYNRLKRGMRLQSDPTVVYALSDGSGTLGRPLTRADLAVADPYNTYTSDGLPPGPIANPGLEALKAVLHPQATSALYFVADGSGGHAFADTLAEHNRNVARWRKLQRQ